MMSDECMPVLFARALDGAPRVHIERGAETLREVREGQTTWVLDPYARLPRVLDRIGDNRPVLK